MPIVSPKIHLNCYNYEKDNPLIEIIEKEKGKTVEFEIPTNYIIIMTKGAMSLFYGMITNAVIHSDEMVVVPFNNKVTFKFLEDTSFILFKLNTNLSFCDHLPLETLYDEKKINNVETNIKPLKVEEIINSYLSNLTYYLDDQIKCSFFQELKIKELLYIIRIYYSFEDIQALFSPIVNGDLMFAEQIYQFSKQSKNIKKLSGMLNYSVSGFEKRFKNVFGISAKKWFQQEKAKKIYHELNCSTKSFAEIGADFGFSSASHFNDYCKRVFQCTPGKIRKMNAEL